MQEPIVPDKVYRIWNDAVKQWQFGIYEETEEKAIHELFKRIGQVARRSRFKALVWNQEERLIAQRELNRFNQLKRNKDDRLKNFGTEEKPGEIIYY